MARPKKYLDESPATEREPALETVAIVPPVYTPPAYVPLHPREMSIERAGAKSEPYTRIFPQVRGGVCEYCGVLDGNVPSQFQYKLCPHYRGKQLRCTYCPEQKDPDEVIYHADLNIRESPDKPGTMIVWCNSYECSRAHENRFKRSTS